MSKWDIEDWESSHGHNQGVKHDHPLMVGWVAEDGYCGFFSTTEKGLVKWIKLCQECPDDIGACTWELRTKSLDLVTVNYNVDVAQNINGVIKAKVNSLELGYGKLVRKKVV